MPVVRMPDGADVSFPDDMPSSEIKSLIERKFSAGQPAPQAESYDLSDVPANALANIPNSAAQFASDMVAPFMDPIGTAKNIGNIGVGAIQKLIPGEQSSEPYADAVGGFFSERYGGWDNVKRTMAEDPVGFLADISTVLTGGGALAAKAPSVAGKAGRAVQGAGRAIDPTVLAGKAGKPIAEFIGATTGTSGTSLQTAAQAGRKGGEAGEAFLDSMRGVTPVEGVVEDAQRAVGNLRAQRGQEYTAGMGGVRADTTVLDMAPIHKAITDTGKVKNFKGVDLSPSTAGIRNMVREEVEKWSALNPQEFHTPEGLDALKQRIGDIRDKTEFGTPERKVAGDMYRAVREQIVSQAPDYAKVMKNYEQASDLIKEMEKTLSLNPKAQIDTQLRKLQSIMRNNANTNYGRREQLGKMLEAAGATTLMEKLAGQSLSAFAPRGISRGAVPLSVGGAYAFNPYMLGALPFQSPRLMGEAAYGVGALQRRAGSVLNASRLPEAGFSPRGIGLGAFQSGRLAEEVEKR